MKRISQLFICLTCVVIVCSLSCVQTYAADAIVTIKEFDEIKGEGEYINSDYRDNYHFDIEKTGPLEVGYKNLNNIANVLLKILTLFGYLVSALFYQGLNFDVADLFSAHIGTIQGALKKSIFDGFFILAFVGAAWSMMKKVAKNDTKGFFVQVGQVILITLLASFVVTNSATVLSGATSITKDLAASALVNIQGSGKSNTESYAAETSGYLWKTLVHDPWYSLEFSKTQPDEEKVKEFLTTAPNTDDRNDLVEGYRKKHEEKDPNIFSMGSGIVRIGYLIVYLIPFLAKSLIFLFMAAIQLGCQLMAIFYVLLAPVILLLSLIPAYGGFEMISSWLRKILETQIMIVIVTFIIGVVIKMDGLLYAWTSKLGWLVVILMETVIFALVVLNYKTILRTMGKVTKTLQRPSALRGQFSRPGNTFETAGNMAGAAAHGAGAAMRTARSGAVALGSAAMSLNPVAVYKRFAAANYEKYNSRPRPKTDDIPKENESGKSTTTGGSRRRSVTPEKKTPRPTTDGSPRRRSAPPDKKTTRPTTGGSAPRGAARYRSPEPENKVPRPTTDGGAPDYKNDSLLSWMNSKDTDTTEPDAFKTAPSDTAPHPGTSGRHSRSRSTEPARDTTRPTTDGSARRRSAPPAEKPVRPTTDGSTRSKSAPPENKTSRPATDSSARRRSAPPEKETARPTTYGVAKTADTERDTLLSWVMANREPKGIEVPEKTHREEKKKSRNKRDTNKN